MSRAHLEVHTSYEVLDESRVQAMTKTTHNGHIESTKRVIVDTTDPKFIAAMRSLGWTAPAPAMDTRTLDLDREFTEIGALSEAGRSPMLFHIENDKINVAGVLNAEQFARLAAISRGLKA